MGKVLGGPVGGLEGRDIGVWRAFGQYAVAIPLQQVVVGRQGVRKGDLEGGWGGFREVER